MVNQRRSAKTSPFSAAKTPSWQVTEGVKINGDGYGSMFYLTTGFHGLHVTGGLIAFILFLIRTTMGRFTPAQATAAIVVSYYWHFVDVVWIALFAMIYFLQ